MSKNCTLLFFLTLPFIFRAQDANHPPGQAVKKRFILFSAGYRMPVNKNPVINSDHGVYVETGFNPARFFSPDAVIGVYAGWGWRDHLWATSFNEDFARQYRSSVNTEALNGADSAIVHFSKELIGSKSGRSFPIPGCETNSFHNYSLYYGIVLRPKEGLPALKLYTGSKRSHYQGTEHLLDGQAEYIIVQLRRKMYGAELLFRDPVRRLAGKRNLPEWLANTGISVYYEYSDLSSSSLYFEEGARQAQLRLRHFMKSTFFTSYKKEQVFGCKISYTIM
jgi:hypothetical protein